MDQPVTIQLPHGRRLFGATGGAAPASAVRWRIKQVEALGGGGTLHRSHGAVDLTLLGIGAIIGTGVCVLTGVAAANDAGPGLVLSFVLAWLACGFAALVYAELAAMAPVAGSAYT